MHALISYLEDKNLEKLGLYAKHFPKVWRALIEIIKSLPKGILTYTPHRRIIPKIQQLKKATKLF